MQVFRRLTLLGKITLGLILLAMLSVTYVWHSAGHLKTYNSGQVSFKYPASFIIHGSKFPDNPDKANSDSVTAVTIMPADKKDAFTQNILMIAEPARKAKLTAASFEEGIFSSPSVEAGDKKVERIRVGSQEGYKISWHGKSPFNGKVNLNNIWVQAVKGKTQYTLEVSWEDGHDEFARQAPAIANSFTIK
jgi:hypothetical protein